MANNKTKSLIDAKNKITKKGFEPILLTHEALRAFNQTLGRPDVKIVAIDAISDTNDEGHYQLVDTNGKILYEVLINPYTVRLLQNDKIIARCNIEPIRGELYDNIVFTDSSMQEVCESVIIRYDQQKEIIHKQTTSKEM